MSVKIKDVAKAAGVSTATVSRVLNQSASVADELKERVYQAIKETNYSMNPIARDLKSSKRNQIAVVIPSLRRTDNIAIFRGISDFFREKRITVVLYESEGEFEREKEIVRELEQEWIDGIILIPGQCREDEEYRDYSERLSRLKKKNVKIPVVGLETDHEISRMDTVLVDHEAAFYECAAHLLEIGRKRLIYLGSSEDTPLYSQELAGIRRAAVEYGGELFAVKNDNFTVMDGHRSAKQLLKEKGRPDGVVCTNDQVAAGALNAYREAGLEIPADTAIVGFGGVALSIVTTPAISTAVTPKYQMGKKAAEFLYERMNGYDGPSRHEVLRAQLAIRNSTLKTAAKTLDAIVLDDRNTIYK